MRAVVLCGPGSGSSAERAIDLFYRVLQVLLTALMMALIVPVVLQILSRFTD